jgi:uncharacterized membrane protein
MEPSVDSRLQSLEERVKTLEALLEADVRPAPRVAPQPVAQQAVTQQPAPWPPITAPGAKPAPARPAPVAREPFDLEEVLGGRVLAWVGGIAVVLAAVFFLVMAVHNGWIDEATRVVLAFLASTALVAAGVWLYERKGQTQAALAAVAAGLAALYASATTATAVYALVSSAAGLFIAGLIGIAATAVAVRWNSPVVAGIGIVGALLAPVLVDAGRSTASLAFMAIALVSAVGVLIWRRWSWLAVVAYVVSAPQAADWLDHERHTNLGLALVVTGLFWALYLVAALGYELREPTTTLRVSSASLLLANAAATAGGGWAMLHDAGNGYGATAWVIGLAAAHVVLGVVSLQGRISREIGALIAAVGAALAAVGLALALDGPALVAGWAAEGVLMAWVARRTDDQRGYLGSAAFLSLAAVHAVVFEAPPSALAYGLDSPGRAVVALALVAGGLAAAAALLPQPERRSEADTLRIGVATTVVYLASVLVADVAGAHSGGTTQNSQLALSALWAALGFALLVAGLSRDERRLRLGGLVLLGLAVAKVFVVDLAALESIWRVASFLGLGLLLLAAAFGYQRARSGTERT